LFPGGGSKTSIFFRLSAAAEIFSCFFKKFLIFEKFWDEKGKIDNRARFHKNVD
jgi:hypothetical protein